MRYVSSQNNTPKGQDDITEAAAKVYEWLHKKDSMLRSLITFLSSGGLFYVAQCHEKCARAFCREDITKEDFIMAARARIGSEPEQEGDGMDMFRT